jgi:hypothetical protein
MFVLKVYDYEIVKRGDYQVLVIRDQYSTGVFTCDTNGIIIPPGNRLLKTHLTYEENVVAYRRTIGEMKNKPEYFIGDNNHGRYFGAIEPMKDYGLMEVTNFLKGYNSAAVKESGYIYNGEEPDHCSLKHYDDMVLKESIYVYDHEYKEYDGTNMEHMIDARESFDSVVEIVQNYIERDLLMDSKLGELNS